MTAPSLPFLVAAARSLDLPEASAILTRELLGFCWSHGEEDKQLLAAAILATLAATRTGSTRLPLEGAAVLDQALAAVAGNTRPTRRSRAALARLLAETRLDGPVGRPGEAKPLLCDGHFLYLHKHLTAERRLGHALRERIACAPGDAGSAAPRPLQATHPTLSDEQAAAVALCSERPLAVVLGGPGTGKTTIAASLVRELVARGVPAESIALTAPTGKAAHRLTGSLWAQLAGPGATAADRAVAERLPAACTVHRLLGFLPERNGFRHDELLPLPVAAVIADEVSMIDLLLMDRLVRALAPETRLILLGDVDQLPSVDAGAVLRDLDSIDPGGRFTARLTHNYRTRAADGGGAILRAAAAIRAGQRAELGTWRPAAAGAEVGVSLGEITSEAALAAWVIAWYRRALGEQPDFGELVSHEYDHRAGAFGPDDLERLARLFALLERQRLLAVSRRLPAGADQLNQIVHDHVLGQSSLEHATDLYPGEPIVMRHNDYQRGLWNGDVGVILRVAEQDASHRFRAVFPRADGFVVLPLAAVRGHVDLAFAMTVHQCQGSEFDHVTLVLPPNDSSLVGRELLYTGVTRARRSVTVLGREAVLGAGLARESRRSSGLAALLEDR